MICVFTLFFTDPRTKPWLLSSSPGPLFTILGTYLYFCLYAGPKYMKDRKPFELKNTLIVYNIVQVILSVVLVIEVSGPIPIFITVNLSSTKKNDNAILFIATPPYNQNVILQFFFSDFRIKNPIFRVQTRPMVCLTF